MTFCGDRGTPAAHPEEDREAPASGTSCVAPPGPHGGSGDPVGARPARRCPALRPDAHFGPPAALVPLASPWHAAAVAAGVVADWLTLMLAASFRLRKRIGQRGWRRLHYATFAAFVLALGHALTSGTTSRAAVARSSRRSRPGL